MANLESGKRLADRYLLQERLGDGGHAEVWAALDTREVARTAVELFSGEKLPARKNQTKYPRSDDLFNAKNLKDIQPD